MQKFLRRRLNDGIFFVILMVLLGGFAMLLHIDPAVSSTNVNHFILQAQAWLHGRLDVGVRLGDTILVNGKIYIIYPPLPALMMLPFVTTMRSLYWLQQLYLMSLSLAINRT